MRTEGLCGRKCVWAPGEVYWANVGLTDVQAVGDAWENRDWDGEGPWGALSPQGKGQNGKGPNLKQILCRGAQVFAGWADQDSGLAERAAVVGGAAAVTGVEPVAAAAEGVGAVAGYSAAIEHGVAGVAAGIATGNWSYLTLGLVGNVGSASLPAAQNGPAQAIKNAGEYTADQIGDKLNPNPCGG